MTVQDDVRRLSQLDSIYLGSAVNGFTSPPNPAKTTSSVGTEEGCNKLMTAVGYSAAQPVMTLWDCNSVP
jgi:hypothetical protein